MTIRPLSREEVRLVDSRAAEELSMPTVILMENAGRGAAAWIRDQGVPSGTKVLILCGPGNNGGDGGVVARHLDLWGHSVRVIWFTPASRLKGDAAVQFQILERAGFDQACWDDGPSNIRGRLDAALMGADCVVDALLGTGLTRPVEGILREVIVAVNRSSKPIFALDLPSGLDADSGQPLGEAIRAHATITFVAPKLGFTAPGAADYTGAVTVVEIGVPRVLLEAFRAKG
jgi:NAD(P)H-hydrate epimerase